MDKYNDKSKDSKDSKESSEFKPTEMVYYPDFLSTQEANTLYEVLLKTIEWENKGNQRDTRLYGKEDVVYSYGLGSGQDTKPLKWLPELDEIRKKIEKITKCEFDVVLCGYYPGGKSGLGWHADREEHGKETPIASISLGAERTFGFRPNMGNKETRDKNNSNKNNVVFGVNLSIFWFNFCL